VPALSFGELLRDDRGEPSSAVRDRVRRAREHGNERLRRLGLGQAPRLGFRQLRALTGIDARGERLLQGAVDRLGLSSRAITRILRVARTIADLEAAPTVTPGHLAEAIQYRVLDCGGDPSERFL
jgi:magnesium chelatase family protein